MNTVTVELGDRSYPIVFAGLSGLGTQLAALRAAGRCVVVSNDRVGPLYAEQVLDSLKDGGWAPEYLELPDGESNKSAGTWLALVQGLLDLGVDRQTPIIALGGGVTGDIVGFAAATTLRGLPFVQVPTSLLAMVDASVGGKTGVNTGHGKNLLGAFHQPFCVYVDVDALTTLPDDELRCGLGEVVKHAVLADPEFFSWLERNGQALLGRHPEALQHAIATCCAIKAAVVASDEREAGRRALLNLGHTIGHAIEHVLGFGALRHGEAVGIGMVAEAWLGVERGEAAPALPQRITALLVALGLPVRCPGVSADDLVEAARMDKKRAHGRIKVTVPRRLGDVALVALSPEDLLAAAQVVTGPSEVE